MIFDKKSFQFLKALQKNNNRDWFADHKGDYQKAHQNAKDVFAAIHQRLQQHDEIEKSKMMRIYRDVRFSKDKTPYKPQFGNSFSRLGRELRGGYFIRIKPGESLIAGGFWEPNKEDIFRIRKEIEMDASEIRDILADAEYQKHFGGEFHSFGELKTAPRGFDKNHPDVDLLRKKGYVAIRNFTDAEVLSDNFIDEVDASYQALRPFFNLFSDILTTNLNGESIL
ncbi:MAG: TIGR02453 family protein [Flavobacteriaceae bacterium]|nr:TIGR02453 family protein [Flavobacteriaceae bacterium]|tara:strand:- start:344093 stop:344767 length:675 start_codon:yes stop_codon:yes gene_type:complete